MHLELLCINIHIQTCNLLGFCVLHFCLVLAMTLARKMAAHNFFRISAWPFFMALLDCIFGLNNLKHLWL